MASASDTVTKYGDPITIPAPQSGWQVEQDGFGLLQAQVKFKWDIAYRGQFPTTFHRGVALSTLIPGVDTAYENMTMWKANMITDKANVLIITADFAGIDPAFNGGARTDTQIVMTGATSSEPIEHHPNFLVRNCTSNGLNNVLAGFPPPSGWDDNKTGHNPNLAFWTPKVVQGGAIQGQQFIGFLPNQNVSEYPDHLNIKAGIKNYYKPSNTLRGLFYVTDEAFAIGFASYVGWITTGELFGVPPAYRALATGVYGGSFTYTDAWLSRIHRSFLVTNCSVERFGNLYKVTVDLMLSGISGWDKDIYPVLPAG